MHSRAVLFVTLLFLALAASPAWGERRVALVTGNSTYATAGLLKNAPNDATAIGEMLRRAKFEVVETKRDLTNTEMRRALRDLSAKSRDADDFRGCRPVRPGRVASAVSEGTVNGWAREICNQRGSAALLTAA